jgi:hypothetical protein
VSPYAKRGWMRIAANVSLLAAIIIFVPGRQSLWTTVLLAVVIAMYGTLTDAITKSTADQEARNSLRRVASNLQRSKP